ncbi:MAG: lasso peptide biosynthesis B2 protein [Bryobacteraceae bacterium]
MTPPSALSLPAPFPVPRWLAVKAWVALASVDLILKIGGFPKLYRKLRSFPVAKRRLTGEAVTRGICSAIDLAGTWYFKHALCLQRSAVATFLLRRAGVPAELVIAVRKMPFQGHAWVEVAGVVVNDTPSVQENYSVLDRL